MNTVQEALKAAIEALEYHTEQTRPIQKTIDTLEQCKSALAEIGKCETTINLNILKYTEYGVIPDDFKGQASGYRAGWNDCLSSIQYMFSQPIEKCEAVAYGVKLPAGIYGNIYTMKHEAEDDFQNWKHKYPESKVIPLYTSPISKEAYDGAREDLAIWKKRALEAEKKVSLYDQRIIDIGAIAMTPIKSPQPNEKCEPVGWTNESQLSYLDDGGACLVYPDTTGCPIPIYTAPQQREWKDIDLSEYEIQGQGAIAEEICTKLKQLNSEKG